MAIILVAAMDRNRGIGNNNKLPWGNPIPEDIANFKSLTLRENVVMGRKTWGSIPKKYRPLPNRKYFCNTLLQKPCSRGGFSFYSGTLVVIMRASV
ncbi:MAG: dihydrofolate reductase [Patescibacteria group bacterium]